MFQRQIQGGFQIMVLGMDGLWKIKDQMFGHGYGTTIGRGDVKRKIPHSLFWNPAAGAVGWFLGAPTRKGTNASIVHHGGGDCSSWISLPF